MTPLNFKEFLVGISNQPLRVFRTGLKNNNYVALNLSETNLELRDVDVSSASKLGDYIAHYIKKRGASVAFGGYNETRNIYKRSNYFNIDKNRERNIHLGMDLWSDAETPVYAPLNGKVHSYNNNTNFGNYGPTIILKHRINGVEFYTLYGHLSLTSIENLQVNQVFKQGEQIATLGSADVNGDYPPHLHFQIIKDLQGFEGDYPGVCNIADLDFYLNNCPDPNVLLKLEV